MPVISAFADHPTRPYVRVETNWADTPSVGFARVLRYDTVTGECAPLRPYVCYDGDYLAVSCDGTQVWWDTETPFCHPVYYIAEGLDAPCLPASPILLDTFNRTLTDSWGQTDTGDLYTLSGGTVPGNYDVTIPTGGTHNLDSVNVRRHAFADSGVTDQNIYADCSIPVAIPSGAGVTQWLMGRLTDVNNWYGARLEVTSTGTVTLILCKRVAGVVTDITTATTVASRHAADEVWTIRLNIVGSQLQAKAWLASSMEPTFWQRTATDTSLPTGSSVGVADRLETGNLNSPLLSSWRRLLVGDPCAPCTPVTARTSGEITLAQDGTLWLKDPVRPCNDQQVVLCSTRGAGAPVYTAPPCPPGTPFSLSCGSPGGILFISLGAEVYGANSFSLRPINRSRTISITRPRSDATTALKLQTLSFADRDAVLALVAPGSPLLFQAPPEYGIPDRYMDIKDVQVSPELPDLRVQIRTEVLPYDTVDRPAGPTQGICGARVADICAEFRTWDELAATGMTWNDLVAGQASPISANPDRRTWNDVNADFATWNAVNTGGRTWDGLEEGL